jgi:hypothetical protein
VVKGVLTSKKLGTPIDSELLIYCLQGDYILNHIWVFPLKSPCSSWTTPLLLSTVDATSTMSVALLCTVYVFPQLIADQLSLEFGGTRSKLCLLLVFGLPAPSVSVPGSMTRCSVVSVTSHSGACLVPV